MENIIQRTLRINESKLGIFCIVDGDGGIVMVGW